MLSDTAFDITEMRFSCVGLSRSHVAQDLTAIKRNPLECSVGEVIDVVPAELLGEETAHPSQAAYLRDLCRVPERIWQPESCASLTEVCLEESLSIQELSDQRLSTWHICIVLDPAPTDGLEVALPYPALHTIKNGWVVLLEPFELLSLRTSKTVLRISFHQITLVRP